jgi:hypothetical protein
MNAPRLKFLTVLLLSAAVGFSAVQTAYAQAARERPSTDELAAVFGAVAFDSIGRSQGGIPAEIRFFVADTAAYRLLQPFAIDRGLHLDILRGSYPSCSWNASTATRDVTSQVGFLFDLSTRVDSAGHFLADARMSCRGPTVAGVRPNRGNFGTGMVLELVKQGGRWRVARVVDHWIT